MFIQNLCLGLILDLFINFLIFVSTIHCSYCFTFIFFSMFLVKILWRPKKITNHSWKVWVIGVLPLSLSVTNVHNVHYLFFRLGIYNSSLWYYTNLFMYSNYFYVVYLQNNQDKIFKIIIYVICICKAFSYPF